jgi:hypothetical protein
MRRSAIIACILHASCGGDPFILASPPDAPDAAPDVLHLLPIDGGSDVFRPNLEAAAPDASQSATDSARETSTPDASPDVVESSVVGDAPTSVDVVDAPEGSPGDGALRVDGCTSIPVGTALCGGNLAVDISWQYCFSLKGGVTSLDTPAACSCVETYTCACIAPTAWCPAGQTYVGCTMTPQANGLNLVTITCQ